MGGRKRSIGTTTPRTGGAFKSTQDAARAMYLRSAPKNS